MIKNTFIHKATKIVAEILFYGGIVVTLLVPYITWVLNIALNIGYNRNELIVLEVFIMQTGVVALYIVWELKKILKTVLEANPFTIKNVEALRNIAMGTLVISLLYFIKLFFLFGIGTIILVVTFIVATLMFLTLKDLFKQAVIYKEETDGVI